MKTEFYKIIQTSNNPKPLFCMRHKHETTNVEAVMNGDLDDFIKAYLMQNGQKETKNEL